MGLVQNIIEGHGIPTISVTLKPEITYGVKVPRAAYIRFPLGHPVGEANRPDQQRDIVRDLLQLIVDFTEPVSDPTAGGVIVRLPYRWRLD